jgi:hypothetical protein
MDLTESDNDSADPLRRVDRRWRRAVYLVENNRRVSPRRDDPWVRAAARFCRALRRCQDEEARQALARRLPALSQAHALYAGPPSLARWHLEARLLTPESFGQVAAKCATTPEVVEAYEAVFFSIRDRIDSEGYILHVAIGRKQYAGLREADVGVLLKRHAFGGGPAALDALIDYYEHPPEVPERPEQLAPGELRALRAKLLTRAWIALDTLPPDGKAMKRLDVLRDAAAVFRGGRGLGDDPDNLIVPLIASPGCREQLAKGMVIPATGDTFAGASIWRADGAVVEWADARRLHRPSACQGPPAGLTPSGARVGR